MCCLFGLMDYRHALPVKQKNQIISALASAAEARGTDATGVAYNSGGKLRIYKRPIPGHQMRFRIPRDASVIIGHTRATTQGTASRNSNNHPFEGHVPSGSFAFTHNGVLFNDQSLRRDLHLPRTKIETDSYIGVQLIEQKGTLDFSSLGYVAEQVEGSFTFALLDDRNSVYLVKGDSPICVYHYPTWGGIPVRFHRGYFEAGAATPEDQPRRTHPRSSGLRRDPADPSERQNGAQHLR